MLPKHSLAGPNVPGGRLVTPLPWRGDGGEVQCPETGGDAVFKARSLYAGIDWTAFYEADNACGGNNLQEGSEERAAKYVLADVPELLDIFPNPTKEAFNVRVSVPDGFEGYVVLRDMTGRTLHKVEVRHTGSVQLIPLTGLSGLFICCLDDETGKILDRRKVVVLK